MKSGYKKPVKSMPVKATPKAAVKVPTKQAKGTPSMMRKGKC